MAIRGRWQQTQRRSARLRPHLGPLTMSEPRAINVRILHGDLRQATYPVVVGHYVGDVIVRAEAGLDRRSTERCAGVSIWGFILRGSASWRSSSVVAFRQERLSLGLGEVGELTPERLQLVFATGLRRYALRKAEAAKASARIGVSSVLIGTDGGAFAGVMVLHPRDHPRRCRREPGLGRRATDRSRLD